LVKQLGGVVHAVAFLVELSFLEGRRKLGDESVYTVIAYEE
jgi:adenine/guanine phosphoribosyltransferase-like PRPP-binding protein